MKYVHLPILVLACSLLISGCKTANPMQKDYYSNGPEHRLPPISVFGKKPSDELNEICSKAQCVQGGELVDAIYNEFVKSEMFTALAAGENKSDYQLQITARRIDPGDAKEFAKVMTSAASLFVVPVVMNHEYRSEFVVKWRGMQIASYNFAIPYDETVYLFKDLAQSKQFAAEAMASKFFSAVQADGVLPASFYTPRSTRKIIGRICKRQIRSVIMRAPICSFIRTLFWGYSCATSAVSNTARRMMCLSIPFDRSNGAIKTKR